MAVYGVEKSIIIYTNLIHISFYNKKPKKAIWAFSLFRKTKIKSDSLIYSKLIDGLLRFKEIKKIGKFIKLAHKERIRLKNKTI